ncbi:unnamed protein product [Brassica rapa]|uniref:Uncharacterized protein n=1 Tax=Brassica campestris TaxID=3711 RepID=A0A8D9LT16_BRACM|nr:unnamed protein product [Brassica rapa]
MTGSCERLSWVGSRKKPTTLHHLREANQQRSFSSSVAEMEKTEEEEDSGEDIGATVVCSCETLANHLTNCGFQSTPRGERVHQSIFVLNNHQSRDSSS